MKNLKNLGFWFLFSSIIYFLINIIHLSWYISNPEGFWSFSVFFDIIRISFLLILLLALALFGILILFDQILKLLKGKLKISQFILRLGVAGIFILIFLFNSFFSIGISFLFDSKMSEKYSYLEASEELIESGLIDKATYYARKTYYKEKKKETSWIFPLTKLWTLLNFNKKQFLLSKYEATTNYAYCQSRNDGNTYNAEKLYLEALNLLDNNLFSKEEKKERAFYANLSLSNLKFEQNQFALAEYFFNKASH